MRSVWMLLELQELGGEGGDPRRGELLKLVEQSQTEGDTERELQLSLKLYDVLKQRGQQGTGVLRGKRSRRELT
jgi:hypothetical protein